jgi:chitinase
VRGLVSLLGNAQNTGLQFYRLDYGQGLNPALWYQIGDDQHTSVTHGELGQWNTTGLDGLYSLRLSVVGGDNFVQQFIVQVTVDNVPPSLQLIHPTVGQVFNKTDEFVEIQPIISDNISMDRVEFYVDDSLIATSTVVPYSQRWFIDKPGTHVIQVRAYDSAGNTVASQRVTVQVLP